MSIKEGFSDDEWYIPSAPPDRGKLDFEATYTLMAEDERYQDYGVSFTQDDDGTVRMEISGFWDTNR
jgi:hypothetical protein